MQFKNLATFQVNISPQLQTHLLATKIKVAPATFNNRFFLKANIPFIKLENGEEKALIPLALMEGPEVNTDAVPADSKKFAPYIRRQESFTAIRTSPFVLGNLVIPTVVDHRPDMTPIRNQGPRGTCVACASTAALEAFKTIPDDLSEQYSYDLLMRKENHAPDDDGGIKTTQSAIYLADGTVEESLWPYTNSIPAHNTTVPAAAVAAQKYKITSYQMIDDGGTNGAASIKNPRYLESVLRAGNNIVFGTFVAWGSANAAGILDVVIDSTTNKPIAATAGHAMVICGFDSAKKYFIVKNSWGGNWQHSGYGYLSYDYIRTYAKYGYYIKTVSPNHVMAHPTVDPLILHRSLDPKITNTIPRMKLP